MSGVAADDQPQNWREFPVNTVSVCHIRALDRLTTTTGYGTVAAVDRKQGTSGL